DTPVDKTYPCHMDCRERRITNTENLCTLQEVAGKRFQISGHPLKNRGGSGSPVRAIAIVEE
ncbi:MAG: cyclase, partial [Firmicutes bacterium]|nr:cyclase [Bacillota bacterium]